MADTKITSLLTPQVTTNPATDVLPIVNIADTSMASSGSTRKITVNTLLGAGGTATLASATITGDLTVDTSTLVVTSSQDRVGIGFSGSASAGRLQISQPLGSTIDGALRITDNATTSFVFNNVSSGVSGIWSSGAIAFGVGSGTFTEAMRLNSTGLGVGGPPAAGMLLTVGATSSVSATANALQVLSSKGTFNVVTDGSTNAAGTTITYSWANGGQGPLIFRNASISNVMTLDSSGNVGIGVTPSAWNSTYKAIEIGNNGPALSFAGGIADLNQNAFYNASAQWVYKTSAQASLYRQTLGQHQWFTAPSGTATNPITFTQRLTLKESGQLRFTPLAADPAGAEAGDVYYNSVSNRLKYYNGTAWTLI